MRADWVEKYPNATKALLMAVMEAQQWCEAMENKDEMAAIIGKRQWINVPVADILGRLKGDINYGNGRVANGTDLYMKFWTGDASYPVQEPRRVVPRREHPLGQVRRRPPTSRRWSTKVNREDLWREAAKDARRRRSRHPGVAVARQGDLLRRQGLRSGQPVRLPRQPRASSASA